jgi:hypothetical protein
MGQCVNIVNGDDWSGIYVEGELYWQGHTHDINANFFIEWLLEFLGSSMEFDSQYEADLEALEGHFPNELKDVVIMHENESMKVSEFWELA